MIKNQESLSNDSIYCEQDYNYKHHVYSAVYIVVFFIGVLFNGAALYVFCVVNKKRGPSTLCLMNLAAADLFFIIFLPLRITYFQMDATWIFGDIMCRATTYSFYFSMYTSIFFLACLSLFRYYSVTSYKEINLKKVSKICVIIWLFTGISTTPFLFNGSHIRGNVTRCFEPSGLSAWTKIMYMNYYALIVGFIIPFLTILVFNGLLIRYILLIPMDKKHIRRQVTMIVLVLIVCCVCFLPYHIQRTVHLHYLVHHPNICSLHNVLERTVVATLSLAILNSCLDPLLYVFVGHGFKTWLLLLFKTKGSLNVRPLSTESGDVNNVLVEEVQMEETLVRKT
ncbi:cysteinyl leukotriene receptor 2-like [Pelobates cultripes]|uniref:Cysteinyl leukotriene receptor 2-like n=1 Tax=Pelobates cultripes TaxID=61616 RepID=A0AAD1W6A6_PELCU|nr:cysteinyl leukotriene receptor 2-like [Pelobates cultripes]